MQRASIHLSRCSASLILRKMQIKTPVRHPLILIRMAIIKQKHKQAENKCWQRCGEIETLVHCWWEYQQYGCPSKKKEGKRKRKKKEFLFDPVIPLLGIYPKEVKARTSIDICIIQHLFTAAKRWIEVTHEP